jgi:ABC-type antimicrobial peptide transport system permease subunit
MKRRTAMPPTHSTAAIDPLLIATHEALRSTLPNLMLELARLLDLGQSREQIVAHVAATSGASTWLLDAVESELDYLEACRAAGQLIAVRAGGWV